MGGLDEVCIVEGVKEKIYELKKRVVKGGRYLPSLHDWWWE
jgi:hypothetical protein